MSCVQTCLGVVSAHTLDVVFPACVCMRPRRLRTSMCVHVLLHASTYVYIQLCPRVSMSACECLHLNLRTSVCVQTIKSLDASRCKWISASGHVFCSGTFRMYYKQVMCAQPSYLLYFVQHGMITIRHNRGVAAIADEIREQQQVAMLSTRLYASIST